MYTTNKRSVLYSGFIMMLAFESGLSLLLDEDSSATAHDLLPTEPERRAG